MFAEPVQDVVMKPVKEPKPKKPKKPLKNQKIWCERTQKFYYKSPPEYYREFYHKNKREKTCETCGAVVISQMSHHIAGKKCQAIRTMKELEARGAELEERTAELESLD